MAAQISFHSLTLAPPGGKDWLHHSRLQPRKGAIRETLGACLRAVVKVGGERLGGERHGAGGPVDEGVFVDHPEHGGRPHAHAHHLEHVHVADELTRPGAGGAERPAVVLAVVAALGVPAPEAQAHGGRVLGQGDQRGQGEQEDGDGLHCVIGRPVEVV